MTDGITKLGENSLQFALDFYKQIQSVEDGNVFFSPFSISTALAMTYAGAKNETAAQMRKVLGFDLIDEDDSKVHAAFGNIVSCLQQVRKKCLILRTANRMYIQEGVSLLPEFAETLETQYRTTAALANFIEKSEDVRLEINQWVEEKTNERIKNLIGDGILTEDTRFVLVNAIYFKGDWAQKFDAAETSPGPFQVNGTNVLMTPMMTQTARFRLGENEDLQCSVLELPYANSHLSMFVLLPHQIDGLPDLEARLSRDVVKNLCQDMYETKVKVTLPKFKLETTIQAHELLREMGMSDLFAENEADLSGITGDTKLNVSAILHKAFIEVNEEGSEAAAATAVVMATYCMMLMDDPEFTADHPFLFFIRDNNSGLILFMGRFQSPEESLSAEQ